MSNGAKWLIDLDDLYGPLSRYVDSLAFKIFGPGIMVLALLNIIIYLIILVVIFYIIKKAYSYYTAFISIAVFIGVFSFTQLTIISNYNFITPYAQQATHGFIVCLILILALKNLILNPSWLKCFLCGLIAGITALIKPEYLLSSVLLLTTSIVINTIYLRSITFLKILLIFFSLLLPTFFLTLLFYTQRNLFAAFKAASHAWLNSFYIWHDPYTAKLLNNFSGFDNIRYNLSNHVKMTLVILIITSGIILLSCIISEFFAGILKHITVILSTIAIIIIGIKYLQWNNIGQGLLGVLIIYGFIKIISMYRNFDRLAHSNIYQLLIFTLALSLLARMLLNGRIYQYGFIQSCLATIVVCSFLIYEVPKILNGLVNLNIIYNILISALILSFIVSICIQSDSLYNAKTLKIGNGFDEFYSFPKEISQSGDLLNFYLAAMKKLDEKTKLVVLPEGIMLNYLSRKLSPCYRDSFFTSSTEETKILTQLKHNQPDYILFLPRDLKEYGVNNYGSEGESGYSLKQWIIANYHKVNGFNYNYCDLYSK